MGEIVNFVGQIVKYGTWEYLFAPVCYVYEDRRVHLRGRLGDDIAHRARSGGQKPMDREGRVSGPAGHLAVVAGHIGGEHFGVGGRQAPRFQGESRGRPGNYTAVVSDYTSDSHLPDSRHHQGEPRGGEHLYGHTSLRCGSDNRSGDNIGPRRQNHVAHGVDSGGDRYINICGMESHSVHSRRRCRRLSAPRLRCGSAPRARIRRACLHQYP